MTKPVNPEPDDIALTMSQVAALCGVVVGTVHSWMGDGPGDLKRNADGKLTLSIVGEWIRKHQITKTSAGRGRTKYPYAPEGWGPAPTEDELNGMLPTKNDVDIRLKKAQALRVEMENDVTAGNLIPVDECMTAWRTILSRVRIRLLRIPTTLAPLVHGDPDMLSIQSKLKEGVNDALSEAAEDWREEIKEADDE